MNTAELKSKLYDLKHTAGINQRYHQSLAWWFGAANKGVQIVVGLLAAGSVVAGMAGPEHATLSTSVSIAGLAAAIALNVIPLGDSEKFYLDFFRRWSDLRTDAECLTVKVAGDGEKAASPAAIERYQEMLQKSGALCASEPAPYRWLLQRCEGDENESAWGPGLRTHAQIEAYRNSDRASEAAAESVA